MSRPLGQKIWQSLNQTGQVVPGDQRGVSNTVQVSSNQDHSVLVLDATAGPINDFLERKLEFFD